MVHLAVILPVHNEEKYLKRCVLSLTKNIRKITSDYNLVISEDGSNDNTFEIARSLSKKNKRIKVFHSPERLGKGGGINKAVKMINSDIIVSMDVDLATDIIHLKNLVEAVDSGYDIAIGSRLLDDSVTERSFSRDFLSKGYNFLVRSLLNSSIKDHQCGFKAFKKNVIKNLVKKTENSSWFWDTEILVRAQKQGFKIIEIPVKWKEAKDSKLRLYKDVFGMLNSLIKFWWEFRNE